MPKAVIAKADGSIRVVVEQPTWIDIGALRKVDDGEIVIAVPDGLRPPYAIVGGEVVHAEPPEPSITDLREAHWADARRYRERCTNGGCVTSWGRVDTDDDSRLKISGAVQMAMLAQMAGDPYSIDWTMSDNSQVTLDAVGMLQMGVSVGEHVKLCHANGTSIRTAIEAAADETALAAIDITAGYPGEVPHG